jgi:hypothetical protein
MRVSFYHRLWGGPRWKEGAQACDYIGGSGTCLTGTHRTLHCASLLCLRVPQPLAHEAETMWEELMENEINKLLAEYDPIGVGLISPSAVHSEYKDYAVKIAQMVRAGA